jgi:hypothetical protein
MCCINQQKEGISVIGKGLVLLGSSALLASAFTMAPAAATSNHPARGLTARRDSSTSSPPGGQINGGKPVTLSVDLQALDPTINQKKTAENSDVFSSPQIIANNFHKLYPNVTIVWDRALGALDTSAAKQSYLIAHFDAGDGPDIGFTWGTTYAGDGYYESLNSILNQPDPFLAHDAKWKSEFPSYFWDSSVVSESSGKIVAIPVTASPGPPTAIYYNKAILKKEGMTPPKSYNVFLQDIKKLNKAGYVGLMPWLGEKEIYGWIFGFNVGPYYVEKNVLPAMGLPANATMNTTQQIQATLAGLYSPVLHAYARSLMQEFKQYFQLAPKGWANITDSAQTQLWDSGKIAFKEDGTWVMSSYLSNPDAKFPLGFIPPPPITNDKYASPVQWTKIGPYKPTVSIDYNIFRPSVTRHPGTLQAAVRFLQYLTEPSNLSLVVDEYGGALGAAYGVTVPQDLKQWLDQPFPKTPTNSWPESFNATGQSKWEIDTTAWVDGLISNAQYYKDYDNLMVTSAYQQIKAEKINTKGWHIVLK